MTHPAASLIRSLEQQGVRVSLAGAQLKVSADRGRLTEDKLSLIKINKDEIVRFLSNEMPKLADAAADVAPAVWFTIKETGDTTRDFDLVARARQHIQEFQPGGNHIYLRIITLDHRRVVVEWRALATQELRLRLSRLLSTEAMRGRPSAPP